MASRRFSTTRRSRAPARKFVWARSQVTNQDIPATPGAHVSDLLAQFEAEYGAQLLGATVVRIRGAMVVEVGATAASVATAVAGVRIKEDSEALTEIDGPVVHDHGDWMLFEPFIMARQASDADTTIYRREIDVKASRKIEELGQGLVLAVDQTVAEAMSYWHYLSIGLKLP